MCGIVAYRGDKDASKIAFEGLKNLEYRGYDSWGIAALSGSGISVVKDVGKISSSNGVNLAKGKVAIAHTRWAKTKDINICGKLESRRLEKSCNKMNMLNFIDKGKYYATLKDAFRIDIQKSLKNRKGFDETIGISKGTLKRIKNNSGYWCNLKSLFDLSERLNINNNLLLQNIVDIKTKNSFPIQFNDFELNESLARLLGHVIGDGGIHVKKEENKYRVFYVNNEPKLLDSFKSDAEGLFGGLKVYFRKRIEHGDELWLPSTVGMIFYRLLEYEKLNCKKRVPSIISESKDEKIICAFLQALYDDEGYLYPNKKMIVIAQVKEDLLEDIRNLIIKMSITPNRILKHTSKNRSSMHYFSITGRNNLIKFNEKIGFIHPTKKEKLRKLLDGYRR